MSIANVDKHISALRFAIEGVLTKRKGDLRADLLMRALLSQVNTVESHFELMGTEAGHPLFLSVSEFDEIMQHYLQLNKAIRQSVIKEPNSLYETAPINGVYELLAKHFKENDER